MTVLQGFKLLVFVCICAFLISIFVMSKNETVNINLDIEEQHILLDDDEYYLIIDNHKLKLEGNNIRQIDLNTYKTYKIIYKYNKVFSKDGGEILQLKPYGKRL